MLMVRQNGPFTGPLHLPNTYLPLFTRRVRICITIAINDHVGYLETPRLY